ncbi:glycogen/starch/alpha-glucan phosphorylase [Marinagarivorans algicola]|uniref:glycogen/starch/alpha-glucan phosphorylase n=1 Tax=Marinagarivorans algicola TaxID=1513270 RepID=UPI0006B5434E|nr:glycogen/starch/alpha-glucan phosphorylase [Marinagarivorans algicola]
MKNKGAKPSLNNTDIACDLQRHYNFTLGRFDSRVKTPYLLKALALTVRDRLMERWRVTREQENAAQPKRVYYLSLEFLLGRSLSNAIKNIGAQAEVEQALHSYGCTLEDLETEEIDAGLGNGGLGRLAACFLDSCATLNYPVMGYGIRYEYGMFHQSLESGRQIESPDHWLRDGNPWELERPDHRRRIQFHGRTESYTDDLGARHMRWVDTSDIYALAYDMPIPGYNTQTVNTLRLWKATATDEFNLNEFNAGDYAEAVAEKNLAEQITMVLYPNDASENGKELRLRQQYFLASASLQDVIEQHLEHCGGFAHFADKNCFQLNDTHPTIAIAELMRLLMDEHRLEWDAAWAITNNTMAYTNHTLLPEALERWSVHLFSALLPRLLEIIYEINARFLVQVAQRWPGDTERQRRMSLIEEGDEPMVRMAYLGIVGSFSVNGVAVLHSRLLKEDLFRDFYELWPHKFNNKTNGVTPRRWLSHCNPSLADLITQSIGDAWQKDLSQLEALRACVNDQSFTQQWANIKRQNKARLSDLVKSNTGVTFNPDSLFDVQVKRIHEYKRQLLNIMHVIHLYDRIARGDTQGLQPRCVLIGGKAAPGYYLAKLIIKLANNVASVVNSDPNVASLLQVVFLPNYCVSAMEVIAPAADLSEQISTAGKEASGTGNMKFMMNGALTIGTYDGANIEILEAVGASNFFLFGLKVEEISAHRVACTPNQIIESDVDLSRVMQLLECGHFSLFESNLFDPIVNSIRNPHDPWMVAADFRGYIDEQQRAIECYQNRELWVKKSIFNTAASGRFSSDRTITEYANDIWKL